MSRYCASAVKGVRYYLNVDFFFFNGGKLNHSKKNNMECHPPDSHTYIIFSCKLQCREPSVSIYCLYNYICVVCFTNVLNYICNLASFGWLM